EGVGPASARRAIDVLAAAGGGDRLSAWPRARERIPEAGREAADALVAALRAAREEPRAGPRAEGLRDAVAPLGRAPHADGALRAAPLRARALLPPPGGQRGRARLRQAVALPHRRGAGVLRRAPAARRRARRRAPAARGPAPRRGLAGRAVRLTRALACSPQCCFPQPPTRDRRSPITARLR